MFQCVETIGYATYRISAFVYDGILARLGADKESPLQMLTAKASIDKATPKTRISKNVIFHLEKTERIRPHRIHVKTGMASPRLSLVY